MSYFSEDLPHDEAKLKSRSQELRVILQGAVRDAHPLSLRQMKEEARLMGYSDREISRAFILLTESGDAVLDKNMKLVPPSDENPFNLFC